MRPDDFAEPGGKFGHGVVWQNFQKLPETIFCDRHWISIAVCPLLRWRGRRYPWAAVSRRGWARSVHHRRSGPSLSNGFRFVLLVELIAELFFVKRGIGSLVFVRGRRLVGERFGGKIPERRLELGEISARGLRRAFATPRKRRGQAIGAGVIAFSVHRGRAGNPDRGIG